MRGRTGMTLGASEIEAKLAKKFAPPEYAFMPQMNQGTGSSAGRRADAVAFSLWPSRGLDLIGFEIKISRSDLAAEIKNPEKAEAIQKFCDYWWIVTPAGLTSDLDILPSTWGLMEVNGTGVKVKTAAPRLTAQPMTRSVIASMFRAFHETVPYLKANFICVDDLKAEIDARATEKSRSAVDYASRDLSHLRDAVKRFEEASGISIDNDPWSMGSVGRIVKAIMLAGGVEMFGNTLAREIERMRKAVETLETAHAAVRECKDLTEVRA